jgi:hypothetical protein
MLLERSPQLAAWVIMAWMVWCSCATLSCMPSNMRRVCYAAACMLSASVALCPRRKARVVQHTGANRTCEGYVAESAGQHGCNPNHLCMRAPVCI